MLAEGPTTCIYSALFNYRSCLLVIILLSMKDYKAINLEEKKKKQGHVGKTLNTEFIHQLKTKVRVQKVN